MQIQEPASSQRPVPLFAGGRGPPIVVGNWSVEPGKGTSELCLRNREGAAQVTTLRADVPGFTFTSNRDSTSSHWGRAPLGPEFATGWTGAHGAAWRGKGEAGRERLREPAQALWDDYFASAQHKPRPPVLQLHSIVATIEDVANGGGAQGLEVAFRQLKDLLSEERCLSTFEVSHPTTPLTTPIRGGSC